jgi:uncharacterized protein (DUF983 family)
MMEAAPNGKPEEQAGQHEVWPARGAKPDAPEWTMPDWGVAIWRGMRGICPSCGKAPIFDGYLKVHEICGNCRAPLGAMPADDAPPYVAMLVMVHLIGFVVVMIFHFGLAPNMVGYGLLLLLLIFVCLIVLRIAKGGVIAVLLKLGRKREALG